MRVHVEAEKKAHFLVEHLAMVEKVSEDELNDIVRIFDNFQDTLREEICEIKCATVIFYATKY